MKKGNQKCKKMNIKMKMKNKSVEDNDMDQSQIVEELEDLEE